MGTEGPKSGGTVLVLHPYKSGGKAMVHSPPGEVLEPPLALDHTFECISISCMNRGQGWRSCRDQCHCFRLTFQAGRQDACAAWMYIGATIAG